MGSFLERGGRWVIAQNVLTAAVLATGPLLRTREWPWGWRAAGMMLCAVGALLGITGVRALGRNRTPYPKPLDDHQLVQFGVYRFVRHPLYSSLVFLSLGWGLAWSNVITLLLAAGLALVLDQKARLEEQWLCERYSEYSSYRQRVRRLIPWIY